MAVWSSPLPFVEGEEGMASRAGLRLAGRAQGGPELSVVVPTFNERDNVEPLVARLREALTGMRWEVIFVDDDSPDGTSEAVRRLSETDGRIRLVERIGRRGLSSACIEGVRAAAAQSIAVMDADLQHDEGILPAMLTRLEEEDLDVVIGTRNGAGGSMGDFCWVRVVLSRMGRQLSRTILRADASAMLSDPMSGFFLLRRSFFEEVAGRLEGRGFKILLDMLATSRRRVRLGEVGYRFRKRQNGQSKLGMRVLLDYAMMVGNKLRRRGMERRADAMEWTRTRLWPRWTRLPEEGNG